MTPSRINLRSHWLNIIDQHVLGGVDLMLDSRDAEIGDEKLATVDVLLNTGFGVRTDQRADIKKLWPRLTRLKWLHAASAGKPP